MADADDQVDMERLVTEHHHDVYRYAFRLTGSAPDAEDLTQQVFLTAQQRLEQLRRPESARSWLFAILRNHFLRTWQHRQAAPATSLGLNLDAVAAATDREEVVDSARLQKALGELPAEFRVVVTMFYFEDCSYREIAKELELPIGTVMSRLARAKAHLRSWLFAAESAPPGGREKPKRKPSPAR